MSVSVYFSADNWFQLTFVQIERTTLLLKAMLPEIHVLMMLSCKTLEAVFLELLTCTSPE